MIEEIKEILNKLKDSVDNPTIDVPTYDGSDSEPMDNIAIIKPNACKQLLDYITNLQQENERLKEYIKMYKCDYSPLYKELKQSLFKSVNNTNKAMEQTEIYKSRCEKAMKLYKNCKEEDYCILSLNMYEVLNGSDENE